MASSGKLSWTLHWESYEEKFYIDLRQRWDAHASPLLMILVNAGLHSCIHNPISSKTEVAKSGAYYEVSVKQQLKGNIDSELQSGKFNWTMQGLTMRFVRNRAFKVKARDLGIIRDSITLGTKINHIEDHTLRTCWWWARRLLMTLSTAWSWRLGVRMRAAVGRAWSRANRNIWTWLVRILISFAGTRAWCWADGRLGARTVASILPVGAPLLSFAFLP